MAAPAPLGAPAAPKALYKPIPRYRDQAFALWNGTLTYLANREWAVPSIEDFQAKFYDLEGLDWPARHLDRFLLQGLSRADWQAAAHYLQQQLLPAVINEATATLPPEVQATSGRNLNRKLKARLGELPRAVDGYYKPLVRRVNVVGSNKAEAFAVERLPGGRVRLLLRYDTYRQLTGLTQGSAEWLGTARLGIPITLALKGGGARNYANSAHIPFYKLTSLGLAENLRGYYRNRFTGDASAYLNSELRRAAAATTSCRSTTACSASTTRGGCTTRAPRRAAGTAAAVSASTWPW